MTSRQLQFAVARERAHLRHVEDDDRLTGYLDAIADVGADVELFDPAPNATDVALFQSILREYDLAIGSVHGPHLQRMLENRDPGSILRTIVRAEHLASVIDRVLDQTVTPSVSTHHPPRLWADDDRSMAEARRTFLESYLEVLPTIEPMREGLPPAFDGSLITATLALENVAPRTGHRYMLRTVDDVCAMRADARDIGHADRLAFTCDVGHAASPSAMIEAMGTVANVHLHSTVEATDGTTARLRERYDIENTTRVGEFDRPGVAHHLPPHVGDLDMPAVFDSLDDCCYDGPVTVELAAPYRRADVVYETADEIRAYL